MPGSEENHSQRGRLAEAPAGVGGGLVSPCSALSTARPPRFRGLPFLHLWPQPDWPLVPAPGLSTCYCGLSWGPREQGSGACGTALPNGGDFTPQSAGFGPLSVLGKGRCPKMSHEGGGPVSSPGESSVSCPQVPGHRDLT